MNYIDRHPELSMRATCNHNISFIKAPIPIASNVIKLGVQFPTILLKKYQMKCTKELWTNEEQTQAIDSGYIHI